MKRWLTLAEYSVKNEKVMEQQDMLDLKDTGKGDEIKRRTLANYETPLELRMEQRMVPMRTMAHMLAVGPRPTQGSTSLSPPPPPPPPKQQQSPRRE